MLALPLLPTASGSSSWRRREAVIGRSLSDRIISRVADLFPDSTHRFSSKGYCVWPPAEVHMATRRELQDWPDHESSEIALSGYSAVY
jgi:hypothetical protein